MKNYEIKISRTFFFAKDPPLVFKSVNRMTLCFHNTFYVKETVSIVLIKFHLLVSLEILVLVVSCWIAQK